MHTIYLYAACFISECLKFLFENIGLLFISFLIGDAENPGAYSEKFR